VAVIGIPFSDKNAETIEPAEREILQMGTIGSFPTVDRHNTNRKWAHKLPQIGTYPTVDGHNTPAGS